MKSITMPGPLKRPVCAAVSLLLAISFALIFMGSNSPLGPAIGSDNAIYLTMGTALKNGYAPYTQVFDHKGPMLFILETIPQLLCGGYSTLAVFVMETLFLWGCLLCIGTVARRFHVAGLPAQLVYLLCLAPIIDGGNYCEEYSALFTLLGALLLLRAFDGEDAPKEAKAYFVPALLFGAAFMVSFLIRANNILPMAGMLLGCAIALLLEKRFAVVGACAGGFLVGCAAAALPVIIWLYSQGALSASIYGAFVHNMMYAETGDASRVQMLLHDSYGHIAIAMAALAAAGGAAHAFVRRRPMFFLVMFFGAAGAGFAAFISHKFYSHYLMLSAPLAAVGAAMICGAIREKNARLPRVIVLALLAAFVLCMGHLGVRENAERDNQHAIFKELKVNTDALLAHVPEDERLEVLGYRTEPKWYVAAEAMPYLKYYFLQEILGQADPIVMDEIVQALESDPPKWLVIFYNRPFGPPYDERVQAIFSAQYEFVDARGEYQLLRLKGE